uniref:Uncharacterized protein n=1 Tax=Arundo donax TaxID=35708 RepID=A0A0A9CGV6_ARUDO
MRIHTSQASKQISQLETTLAGWSRHRRLPAQVRRNGRESEQSIGIV